MFTVTRVVHGESDPDCANAELAGRGQSAVSNIAATIPPAQVKNRSIHDDRSRSNHESRPGDARWSRFDASSTRRVVKLGDQNCDKFVERYNDMLASTEKAGSVRSGSFFPSTCDGSRFGLGSCRQIGFLGPPGASMVSWGNFHNFLAYTAKLNPWCPNACLPMLGVVVTFAEAVQSAKNPQSPSHDVSSLETSEVHHRDAHERSYLANPFESRVIGNFGRVRPSCR
jgi:hypothetical protein